MKKQILILIVGFLAISISTIYGQAVHGIDPIPVTCANGPLTPIAGRPYDYTAVINPVAGMAYWYATNSTTFTNGGVRVASEIPADGVKIAAGATNYRNLAAAPASPTQTQVTWTTAGLAGVGYPAPATPLFMVIEYAGPTCANNMKVMKIQPVNAFTLDITNIEDVSNVTLGYGVAENQCVDKVRSSVYDAAEDNITIDYGADTLFFEVIAANFTGAYTTTFQLDGVQGTQTFDLAWGYVKGTYDQAVVAGQASGIYTSPAVTVTTSETNTEFGVSIYARVIVQNHGFETLADTPITLAVEGFDASNNPDVLPALCVAGVGYEDIAMQTINARPAITPGTNMLPQKP